ncbi:(2Fe-2S) ferredoxin domain-containing protein [Leptolyngbya sp. KIOST-1]|uniref:(2Fe-2S) ferredoxin domain-containing protein n=1 Tax=Leptolyngbya sp. KIOST-1 TaxID=1229172 RepID=UPI00056CD76D|nr:(2Fe-2S) ferredoxin domain-containing protein [Leptolyngbya sp. KIOST-1]
MAGSPASPALPKRWLVQVCRHRSCDRGGSAAVLATFREYQNSQILVAESDCMGQCSAGPTVKVMPGNTWYCRVTAEDVPRIVDQHLNQGEPVRDRLHPRFHPSDLV